MLQRPDETCYTNERSNDDSILPDPVPCDASLLGMCNNDPMCAADLTHAINYGSLSCTTFTVWNNEDDDCPWEYMCCN
jgi:hypothetical protein